MSRIFPGEMVKTRAAELGFSMAGIVPAMPSPMLAAYEQWISAGMHGEMGYMARPDRVARRRDLNVILPGIQSLIVVALDYGTAIPPEILHDRRRGRIAAYAWGIDYHDLMLERLEQLAAWLHAQTGAGLQRAYVDTGAILERSHAHQAGLGFTGKNTMLIHPRRGSQFFIGEILTTLEFTDYDRPAAPVTMCGTCTRCLTACPTNAFPAPHVLDARRCISYLTIEYKGAIDPALRAMMGNWIYGCDVCQDVCPFNRFSQPAALISFHPADIDRAAPPLVDALRLDEPEFKARFSGSPITRIKHERWLRNAAVAAGNSGDPALIAPLSDLVSRSTPLVAEHARWAINRLENAPI